MGIIDRAFGVDKNSRLFSVLAFHWEAVASLHENFLKKNQLNEEDTKVFIEIQKSSKTLVALANASMKGFGISSPDIPLFVVELEILSKLYKENKIETDKKYWLPEAIIATRLILNGDTKQFQNRDWWFSR
jgi:hypothetical protein